MSKNVDLLIALLLSDCSLKRSVWLKCWYQWSLLVSWFVKRPFLKAVISMCLANWNGLPETTPNFVGLDYQHFTFYPCYKETEKWLCKSSLVLNNFHWNYFRCCVITYASTLHINFIVFDKLHIIFLVALFANTFHFRNSLKQ